MVDIPDCPLHHPAINLALIFLKDMINKTGIEPYVEDKKSGLLRYVQMVVERKSNKIQLVLVQIFVKEQHGAQMKKCVHQRLILPLVLVSTH